MKSKTLSELEDHLEGRDRGTRTERAERLAELMLLGEPVGGRMLFGDCLDALYEAQWSYIEGRYLSTVLATQACVEKLLSGLTEFADIDQAEPSYARLLRSAVEQRLITVDEYELFDSLRRRRNAYGHYRGVNHPDHPVRRAIATNEPPDVLLRADAQAAVRALVGLVNRGPFAVGPAVAPFSEDDLLPRVHPDQMSLPTASS